MDDGDWTPAKMVSPVDGLFSDSMGFSPSTSLINAIGAPAISMPGHIEDGSSLSMDSSLNMSPEVVRRSMRQSLRAGLSSKHSYRNWTTDTSQPQAAEKRNKRPTTPPSPLPGRGKKAANDKKRDTAKER